MELLVLMNLGVCSAMGTINIPVCDATNIRGKHIALTQARSMLTRLAEKHMLFFENRYVGKEQNFMPCVQLTVKGKSVLEYKNDLDVERVRRLSTRIETIAA